MTARPIRCVVCRDRAAWSPRWVCVPCYKLMRLRLAELAAAYDWLGECMAALSSTWHERTIHAAPVEPPAPMPLHLTDVRARISDNVLWWVQQALEAKGGRARPPAEPTVPAALSWLAARIGWLVRQPPVADFAGDVDRLLAEATSMAPMPPDRVDLPLPCPRCATLGLSVYGRPLEVRQAACRVCRACFSLADCRAILAAAQISTPPALKIHLKEEAA